MAPLLNTRSLLNFDMTYTSALLRWFQQALSISANSTLSTTITRSFIFGSFKSLDHSSHYFQQHAALTDRYAHSKHFRDFLQARGEIEDIPYIHPIAVTFPAGRDKREGFGVINVHLDNILDGSKLYFGSQITMPLIFCSSRMNLSFGVV